MYPKNKPLPAEAAGRAASVTFKRGAEKAASDAAAGGVAGPSSLGAPVRLPQSDDNSRSTSSSHHSSRQNIPMKQASRPLATAPLPPAYQEGLRDGPLCEGSFHSDCMYNGGAPMVMPGGGIRGSSSHQFLQSAVPPPPYEELVPSASGLKDERAYDPLCGMGGAPQPPPPPPPSALLPPPPPPPPPHTVAPTGCVDSSYYDGRQLHQFAPPSMPPPPPWPSHEVGPPPPMPGTELPYYRDSNGMGQPQAPYMHLPRFPWAGPHFVQHKGKGEAGRLQLDENLSERKSDKSEEMEKFSEFLQSHRLSVMSNVSMKGQSDEQQQLLLSWMERTKRFSQQHRHDVAFLTHLVMVLLERLTSIKCTVSATEAVNGGKGIEGNDGSIDAEEGDTPMVPSKDDDEDDGEVVALRQQLSELQDVLSSMEMEDSAMTPRRRNLLAGILALPQLLPLSTMALNCHEKSASSLADTESLADEKEALSRYMTTEVKTLMKAMDFETTRPLTLNVVAPSPPPPPRVDRCCATTIH